MASLQHVGPSASNLQAGRGKSAPAAVTLSNVTRVFGVVPGIVRVSLTVEPGECVLIRGPNGAGKTTLLRVMATAISPTYGSGAVFGYDLVGEREAIRPRLEFLGHRARLYDDLSARENLAFTCSLYGLNRDGIDAALNRVGLADVADERVRRFSHGMRQRVAVARAMVRSPDLLLLDEPYAGLDERAKELVDRMIEEATGAGRTVVVATHDVTKAAMATRVLFMDGGRMLPELPPAASEGAMR